jgi:hypothetical protein
MAYTLAQLNKIETDPLRSYVIRNLLREIKLAEYIPWVDVNSLSSVAVRWRTLPSVAFRKINAGYTPSEGQTEQVWESVYGLGGEIKFDRVFDKVTNVITDPKRQQMDMKLYSLALTFNEYLISGDHATEEDGFEGLQKRISNMPSDQSVYYAGSAAAALDPTGSTANARAFFDKLEEQVYKTNDGDVNVILCNRAMKYGFGRVARYGQISGGNLLAVTQDSFDRQIPTYAGAPIIDMGLKKDQSTEIILDSETAGDAGTDATSVYMAGFDEQKALVGIQLPPGLEVYDPLSGAEQEATPTTLMRVEWWLGLATFGNYGISRGRNVEGASNWT